jgi:hypothetical protein
VFFGTVGYAQPGLFKALINAWFRPAGRLAFSSLCRVLYLVARAASAARQPGKAALVDKIAQMARGGGFRDLGHSLAGRRLDDFLTGSRAAAVMHASTQFLRAGIAHF